MLLVMFAPFALNAGEIIVGNGTSNTNTAPFRNSSAYSWVEMIYQSDEIGQACEITSLSYQCVTAGFFGTLTATELKVYLAEVTKSELATNNFTPESELTLVYSGTNVEIGDEEWETLTFDTPFNYSGENNLVIVVSKSANASNLNLRWTCSATANSILFDFHDTDPAGALFPNANSYMGGAGYIHNQRPIVKLGITGEANPDNGDNNEGGDDNNEGGDDNNDDDNEPEIVEGDTWQNAIIVTEYPFTSTPDYANLNNDYTLPGETQDGADAVYKLTFASETVLSASVSGTNGKLALYAEDFNGENGPGADNYYVEEEPEDPENPDDGELTSNFTENFNGNLDKWRLFQYDTDNYNWEQSNSYGAAGPDNSTCIKSSTYEGSALTPDNFIVTKSKYSITSTSTFSFYVSPKHYTYIFDKYGVVISEDNENWSVIYSEAFDYNSEQGYVSRNIDLSAYAGKNVYIGFRHYDSNGEYADGVLIDNVVLSGNSKRNGDNTLDMTVPAGVYYLVASATEAFTVNINVNGAAQIAKVSFEVEVLGGTSVKTTARPNEFTAEYHYSIFSAAEVEQAGIETLAEELREDETPYSEIDVWTWTELTPHTEYYLIGTAKNAQDEWGPTTFVSFTTTEDEIEYEDAEVTLELKTINATSVVVSVASNEFTAEYHVGTISKALFENLGESNVVQAIRNDGNPHTGNNEHTFGNLNPLTEYYVIATAKNEGDEWGETAIELFTTVETDPEPQIAEVTIEVEVLGPTSVKSTATPNEFAVGYIYSIYDKADVDASGADAIAAELQMEGVAFFGVDEWVWEELSPNTEYYFIGTAQNSAGEWGPTASVSFKTNEDGLVEINNSVSVYPNPASSVIYVTYENDDAQLSFTDMTGRCVKTTEISGNATINVEDLEKGLYIIKIQDKDNTMIHRVVVK